MESINQRLNGSGLDGLSKRQLQALFEAVMADNANLRADIAAVNAQLAVLIDDYNANSNISTDTNAVAPALDSGDPGLTP